MTVDPMEVVRETLRDGDELVEVTGFNDAAPVFLVGRRAADIALAQLRAFYLDGRVTIEQFEQALDEIMVSA